MTEDIEYHREKALHALHGVLERDNSLSRCCAVRALGRLNACDTASRQRLIELLLDPDPDVRADAAAALGRMRVAEATEPLLGNLENDPEGDVRIQAVRALAKIRSKQAVEPLIRCLNANGYPHLDQSVDDMEYCSSWEVQSQTLSALGEIGDQRASGPVIMLLEHEEYADLQESGFRVLAQLSDGQSRDFLLRQLKQGDRLARRRAARTLTLLPEFQDVDQDLPAEVLHGLSNALLDPDPHVRIGAARALERRRNPLVTASLTLLLNDPDGEVKTEVAALLGKTRAPEVINRLHPLLDEADPNLTRRIVQVLGEFGDPASVEPLGKLLDTHDGDLRYEVIGALGAIGRTGPENKIAGILADEKADFNLRIQAAEALGGILKNTALANNRKARRKKGELSKSKPKAQENTREQGDPKRILVQSIFDEDGRVGYAALAALVEMDPERAADRLVDLLRNDIRVGSGQPGKEKTPGQAARTQGERPKPAIPKPLDEILAGGDPQTSTLASILAGATEGAPGPHRHPGGKPAARIPENSVCILAARLLGNLPKPGPRAVKALTKAAKADETGLRREALIALGRIGDAKALAVVVEGLKANQPEIRLAALDALGRFAGAPRTPKAGASGGDQSFWTSGADEQLVQLLRDPDADIRQRAVRALALGEGPHLAQYLRQTLEDKNPEVCRAALGALSKEYYDNDCSDRVMKLMFRFSGELREEASATLRRLEDFTTASRLLATLDDPEEEEHHWICIDALAEMYACGEANASEMRRPK